MTNLYAMAVRHSPSARYGWTPTPQSTNEQEVEHETD